MASVNAVSASAVTRAIVVATGAPCHAVVGGIPLGARAVLTLRSAGFAVSLVEDPSSRDVEAWLARRGIRLAPPGPPVDRAPVLVITGDVIFEARVLAPLLTAADPGRLRLGRGRDPLGGSIRVAVAPGDTVAALVGALSGGQALEGALRSLPALQGVADPVLLAEGLFLPLDSTHPPSVLTAALLEQLGRRATATDGYLATLLDRPVSRRLTRWLLPRPVTPNQITVASLVIGLVGGLGLASVSYAARLGGVLALLASSVLDGVDGEVARARFEQTAAGAWLDLFGDYVVHLATFAGLAVGLARAGLSRGLVAAAGALVVAVAVAIVAMHRLVNGPALARSDDLHDPDVTAGLRGTRVIERIEKLAGRDYVYLLLLFAVLGRLDWFVSAAAIGAWGFVAVLLVYRARCDARAVGRRRGRVAPRVPPVR
jgi:phosphatidylglycerophosphate synthase